MNKQGRNLLGRMKQGRRQNLLRGGEQNKSGNRQIPGGNQGQSSKLAEAQDTC